MTTHGKVELSTDRHGWQPSPLTEQVVIVTTRDAAGTPHVAVKSRVSVVSYGPPAYVFFACNADFATAQYVQQSKEFVINVPSEGLVAVSWVIGCDPSGRGVERFDENGLTRIPGLVVDVPRIAECRAHVECELAGTQQFGPDLAVFGKVVAVSVDRQLTEGETALRYQRLAPFFFLDMDWTAPLGAPRRVDEPVPGPRHDLTILACAELTRSVEFYRQAFDWPIVVEEERYVELGLPGGRGLGLCSREAFRDYTGQKVRKAKEDRLSGVELYLRCEDLARAVVRVAGAGARELSRVAPRDWGEEAAYFADPDGNVIVLARPLKPADG
jgi:flavin reductase (DIM6/NTAB) family NADH-FMN oxidoreductase RutF/catechol 2,3-dioxygenase-like lactoylglutathione lyase family enzyme